MTIYPNEHLAREASEKRIPERIIEKPAYEFSDEDFSRAEDIDPAIAEKFLWAFEQDNETGAVTVTPANGKWIVIHGKQEAEMFCRALIECFQ